MGTAAGRAGAGRQPWLVPGSGSQPGGVGLCGAGADQDTAWGAPGQGGRPDHLQARWFAALDLECSWTTNDGWLAHQRLELENDLIAAHVLEHGAPPSAQFLG
jgi:hypothetical protein